MKLYNRADGAAALGIIIVTGGVALIFLIIAGIAWLVDEHIIKPRRAREAAAAKRRQEEQNLRQAVQEAEQLGLIDPSSDHPALQPLGYPKTPVDQEENAQCLTHKAG